LEEWVCYRCEALRFRRVKALYATGPSTRICSRCLNELRADALKHVMRPRVWVRPEPYLGIEGGYEVEVSAEARRDWLRGLMNLTEAKLRRCEVCGRRFAWIGKPKRGTCSPECVRERRNRARRVQHERKECATCNRQFMPKRADAIYCSRACQQAAHRRRQADRSGA
jgi:hypothetical protein